MNQKRTMKLWQMLALLILSAAILTTMFLPAYHIDPDVLEKGMENGQIKDDYYKNDAARDKDFKKYRKKFKKAVNKEKKENGTDNASISVLKLMTSSLSDIRYNGKYDEEYTESKMGPKTYDALNGKHRMTRVLLWMVYGMLLAVVFVIILGYCLKWNKYISLSAAAVYGTIASAAFVVLRFMTITKVEKEVGKLTEKFMGLDFNKNIDQAEIASSFLSYAFLAGLIAAVVFLAVSVIAMFAGNQAEAVYDDAPDLDFADEWGKDIDKDWNQPSYPMTNPLSDTPTLSVQEAEGSDAPFEPQFEKTAGVEEQRQQTFPQAVPSPDPVQKPPREPASRNGKVRCTKGMTAGSSGYQITQGSKVVVGKSPHQANLVIVNNGRISNVHCTVRYDPGADTYIIKDHSTNGTFINGARMKKEVSAKCPSGTVLSLADGSVEITLG